MDFDAKSQLLITHFAFVKYLRKNWNTKKHCINSLYTSRKLMISVTRDVLYNILIEFGIPMNLVRLIKMSLNETFSRVRVGMNLSDVFPIRNGLKQEDALSPLLFNMALDYALRRVQVNRDGLKLSGTHQLRVYADYFN